MCVGGGEALSHRRRKKDTKFVAEWQIPDRAVRALDYYDCAINIHKDEIRLIFFLFLFSC
jgi:hypothetical protein